MSVILLVDGLHELYAGTAGGGQVTMPGRCTITCRAPRVSDPALPMADVEGGESLTSINNQNTINR
jgi:hypothetical protein